MIRAALGWLGVGSQEQEQDKQWVDSQEQCLQGDILCQVLGQLDSFTLGRVLAVCKDWKAVGMEDALWRRLCYARWNLQAYRSHGRYKYGERTWYECCRVFHRRMRLPKLPSVSDREVVYALGRQHRIGCWMLVMHQPACRLLHRARDDGSLGSVLLTRLVMQNLRECPLNISTQRGFTLTFRDGVRTSGRARKLMVVGASSRSDADADADASTSHNLSDDKAPAGTLHLQGYLVATAWLPGGYLMATARLPHGYIMAWLPHGYRTATSWLPHGYRMAIRRRVIAS